MTDVNVTEGSGIDGWFLAWKNSDTNWEAKQLAAVAVSGAYADLTGKPTLFSAAYADLTGKPSFATVATSGAYADLSGKPTLAAVATSGAYADLTGRPSVFSGAYSDLTGRPTIPTNASFALSGLSDVVISAPTDGQALVWNATASKWEPGTVSGGGGGGGSSSLSGDSDVTLTSPSDRQVLTYDGGSSKWKNANSPYNLGAFLAGTLGDGETLMAHIAPYDVAFPSGLSGSFVKSGVAAAASTMIKIQKNGSTVGTITFASSATTGTIAITGDPSLVAGDVLSLVAPATADTALADVALTFAGYRA